MNYVDKLNLFGVEAKEIPCIKGSGAPTSETVGAVGLFYMDTDNGDVYKCIAADDDNKTYEWKTLSQESAPVEPAEDDIPKVFIDGAIPTTKNEVSAEMNYISKTESFHAYLKIKCQGNSSMSYPKKNFTIKMYSDEDREIKLKKDFKDWEYETNKYVLKANWVDHTHARNIVCARLWSETVRNRADYYSIPTELRNSPNNGAVDGFPIKLYANGIYQGLYTWNIGKDDWAFGMDEDNVNHIVLCAETNTNGTFAETPCNFRALWDGVNENHWSVEVGTNSEVVKNSLNALITCVKDTEDDMFMSTIGNYLDLQSAIDYYIHQYVICGVDGLAKNMLLLTYNGAKWYCSSYDMDLTFGATMSDDYFKAYNTRIPEDCGEQFSLLWERIEDLYANELVARYNELRKKVYSVSNIIDSFERFTDVIDNDLYKEDGEIYPDIISLETNNIKQIREFVQKRLDYCDIEFKNMKDETYTIVEYIESHGNEYINTGVSGGTNASYEIAHAWTDEVTSNVDYDGILGSTSNSPIPCLLYVSWCGMLAVANSLHANLYPDKSTRTYMPTRYTSEGKILQGNPGTEMGSGVFYDLAGNGWGDKEWYVFSTQGSSPTALRLKYLKMYTDGELVRDFVPAKRDSDNVYGLFDNISGMFFENNGTGAFTGP